MSCDLLGSSICTYDAYCLLRCGIVQYHTYLRTFRKYVLPPPSWSLLPFDLLYYDEDGGNMYICISTSDKFNVQYFRVVFITNQKCYVGE
jgi:hypothetical protein